jgi:glycosyltransferase involved in cell wall biosynthesis
MRYSIITVCYNSAKTIRNAIESVISQKNIQLEYIIIDGLSSDGTLGIIKECADCKENIHWISERDKGIYDAMNKGIALATGDIIGILNSDDFYTNPYVLSKVNAVFESSANLDSVYADICYVNQENPTKIARYWVSGQQRSFKKGWHPAHPAFFVKREVYNKYGYFNLDYKLASDFEIMLRLLEKYKISTRYMPEYIINMRLGGTTNRLIKNIIYQNIECLKAFKENNIPVNIFLYPLARLIPKIKQSIKKGNDRYFQYGKKSGIF